MSLYDEIKSHFVLPDAFADWENYRNTLTDYLTAQTDSVSLPLSFSSKMNPERLLPTLAILGAGACNDLDLERLSSHFSRITLIDCQSASMQTALQTYHLESCPVIECLPYSLNGLTDSDHRDFCEELQFFLREEKQDITPERFEAFALSLIDTLFQKSRPIPLSPASYDYIWCFGVHSQLLAMFSYIYHVFEVNLKNSLFKDNNWFSHAFSRRLKEENDRFIPLFHDTLLASARQAVFLGLEQSRLGQNAPIEGASQAIRDIRSRNLPHKERKILWPFCPAGNLTYEMLMFAIWLS